ncbi:right-handed parallel beta-helix repeat-containing protein [Caballeronia sp. LZ001]|uniref:right-handed parallel beta-helix repeat-containing protein n=1 Tax=Caballeronia sp. LZ001 TaxID=3038553 RepID=UPI00285E1B29|nr:right-handed parallel beta-helix repeat-containing protein [Caballeronia sp. LZ001]MDR5802126.1 right-handed parallel beta-helix repeat-containing protein [Caballeronia sp. LZ001]
MASILPAAKTQYLDANGRPLVGGKAYFYFVGTETKKDTFQDPDLSIPNANPVILDSFGEASIWGTGAYRQVLKDKDDQLIWDQVTQESGDAVAGNFNDDVFVSGTDFTPGTTDHLTLSQAYGSIDNLDVHFDAAYQGPDQILSLVDNVLTFTSPIPVGVERVYVKGGLTTPIAKPGSGTVGDNEIAQGSKIYNRINDFISVKDFGAKGNTKLDSNGAYISGANDTASVKAAFDYAASCGGGTVCFPPGTYFVNSSINVGTNVTALGMGGTVFYAKPSANYFHCFILGGKNPKVLDLAVTSDPALIRGDTGFGICVLNAQDAVVSGNTLYNCAALIWVTESIDTRVTDNKINNSRADGIHFSDGAVGGTIDGNIITGTEDDAIAVVLDTVGADLPGKVTISGNAVVGTKRGQGVCFIGCFDVSIVGNTFTNLGAASAIGNYQWNADTRMASNILIAGNTISRPGLTVGSFVPGNELSVHGILIGYASNVTITGNLISDIADNAGYTSAAIALFAYQNIYVRGNTIQNCTSHGVWVVEDTGQTSTNLKSLHIDGNEFYNVVKYAIRAKPASAFLDGLFITDNKFKDCSYDASVANYVVSVGRTQATPLRYYGNKLLNRETSLIDLDPTNATDIRQANNIPAF